MNSRTELEQQVGDRLLGLLDQVGAPVDCVFRNPVGQILLHHPGLTVDDGEHQWGEAGLGGDSKEFPSLGEMITGESGWYDGVKPYRDVIRESSQEGDVSSPAGDVEESGSGLLVPPVQVSVPQDGAGLLGAARLQELHELGGEGWPVLVPRTARKE